MKCELGFQEDGTSDVRLLHSKYLSMSTLCDPLNREQFNSFSENSKERGREGTQTRTCEPNVIGCLSRLKPNFCQNFKNVVVTIRNNDGFVIQIPGKHY